MLINDCGCELRSLVDLCPFRHKKKVAAVQEKLKKVEVTKKVREESRLMGSVLPPSHLSLSLSCSFISPPFFLLYGFLLPLLCFLLSSPKSDSESQQLKAEMEELRRQEEEFKRKEEELAKKERVRSH